MKAINGWSMLRRLGTLFIAVVVAPITIATPMMAASQDKKEAESQKTETSRGGYEMDRFAEQARDLGLTPAEAAALQKKVDQVVAKTGGMQIGINKVLSKDGLNITTIPLAASATPMPEFQATLGARGRRTHDRHAVRIWIVRRKHGDVHVCARIGPVHR